MSTIAIFILEKNPSFDSNDRSGDCVKDLS